MNTNKPICKRCMLDEILENYENVLEDYLSSLDDSIRTDKGKFEKRVEVCGSCDHLMNGVCRLCGCFVKARAAKKQMECPSTPPKWRSQDE